MPSIIGNMPIDNSKPKASKDTPTKYLNLPEKMPSKYITIPKQGSQAGHHVTTVPPKKNTMNQSERNFEAGQKLKAKILKKTGVYKNTAN
jgi:hypothetical protein